MTLFKPTLDELGTLRQAVGKYSHDPVKSSLLSLLESDTVEINIGGPEWSEMKVCIGKYHLHLQAELHRNSKHKPTKAQFDKIDALARKFTPNFS